MICLGLTAVWRLYCERFKVRDPWTGYLVPGRDGPCALPNEENCWDAVAAAVPGHDQGWGQQNHVVAVASLVRDFELHRTDDHRRPFVQVVEGSAHGIKLSGDSTEEIAWIDRQGVSSAVAAADRNVSRVDRVGG